MSTPSADIASDASKPRILCVDDEPGVLRGLQRLLRSQFHVDIAESGKRGLELLESESAYEVILSDMRMPGMTGIDFLNRARQVSPLSTRVLLTGQADITTVSKAIENGLVLTFMLKPFEALELRQRLAVSIQTFHWAGLEQARLIHLFNTSVAVLLQTQSRPDPVWSKARAQRVRRLVAEVTGSLGIEGAWRYELVTRLLTEKLPKVIETPTSSASGFKDREDLMAECSEHAPMPARDLLLGTPRLDDIEHLLADYAFDTQPDSDTAVPTLVAACAEFDRMTQSGEQPGPIVKMMQGQEILYAGPVLAVLREHHSFASYGTWDEDTEVDIGPLLEGLFD